MTSPLTSPRSTPYFFSFQTPSSVDEALQSTREVLRSVSNSIVTGLASARLSNWIFRQEVPIERWFYDHGRAPFRETKEELKARGFAILHTLEGAVRVVGEAVCLLIAKFISKNAVDEERHKEVLKIQMQSVRLSAWAIFDPTAVIEHIPTAGERGNLLIGCQAHRMRWGTPYNGTLTIPISLNYHWRQA